MILIEQAFLNRFHFDFTLDQASQEVSRKNCIDAAFKIWRLLEAYRRTFTLRHAHYGEFYAAYSAAFVILQQAPDDHDEYIECIKFFWSMLSEPQRRSLGFALGLKKPFRLLQSFMRRNKSVAQQINVDEPENLADGSLPSGKRDSSIVLENVADADYSYSIPSLDQWSARMGNGWADRYRGLGPSLPQYDH